MSVDPRLLVVFAGRRRAARRRVRDRLRSLRSAREVRRGARRHRQPQRAHQGVVDRWSSCSRSRSRSARPAMLTLFAFASFFALREFITLTPTRSGDYVPLLLCFFVLLPAQYVLIGSAGTACSRSSFRSTRSCCCRPSPRSRPTREDFLTRCAKMQWGVMICVYCISYAPALLLLEHPGLRGLGGAAARLSAAGRAAQRRVAVRVRQAVRPHEARAAGEPVEDGRGPRRRRASRDRDRRRCSGRSRRSRGGSRSRWRS